MSKLLYIGAREDFDPLIYSNFQKYVFVDSLPRNPYGEPYYWKPQYHPLFKQQVKQKLHENGYHIEDDDVTPPFTDDFKEINVPDLDSHCVEFYNEREDKRLQYFFSTSLPHESYDVFQNKIIPHITKDDNEYPDTLFVRGHHPHKDVIEMLKKPFRFVGCYPTYFPKNIQELDQDNHNHGLWKSCMYDIIKNSENMVNQYTYIDRNSNLHNFSTYDDFYNFYKNQSYEEEGQ